MGRDSVFFVTVFQALQTRRDDPLSASLFKQSLGRRRDPELFTQLFAYFSPDRCMEIFTSRGENE